jgi:hypothetical protein
VGELTPTLGGIFTGISTGCTSATTSLPLWSLDDERAEEDEAVPGAGDVLAADGSRLPSRCEWRAIKIELKAVGREFRREAP